MGCGTLRWSQDDAIEIGFKSASLDVRKANLYFDNDHLVLVAGFQQQKILATLDTGAESTDLYGVFAKEFASYLSASGKKGSTEVRGIGHAESYDSITVPELKFQVSGVETALRPAHILLNHNGAKCCLGNFGLDLLRQVPAFKIDFGAMRLTLEAKHEKRRRRCQIRAGRRSRGKVDTVSVDSEREAESISFLPRLTLRGAEVVVTSEQSLTPDPADAAQRGSHLIPRIQGLTADPGR